MVTKKFSDYLTERDKLWQEWMKKHWPCPRYFTANLLTIARFPLLIPIIVFIQMGKEYWALAIFFIACGGILDILDGPVARTFKQESELGKFLDPLADKLVILLPLWTAAFHKEGLESLIILMALTVIESLLILKRILTKLGWEIGSPEIKARLSGKIKSYIQFFGIGAYLIGHGVNYGWLVQSGIALIVISTLLAAISLKDHFDF
ncbi:MAG: CDP-alcohol phosphatidyltransferase family protein [Patescibacteria group bacterium]|nr:CDP-alcohol phosphatidyltransferase family protein [Patescibacteria group bacterium]MDD5490548.1 CDP-alcohol phosphatidyltransferase family protein [Patescibacteria group bacterium]